MRRRVERVRVAKAVTMTMTMMMCVEIEVFHCWCCCSGQESGGKRQSGDGGASLMSGIGSDCRRETKRHLFPGPVDARGERDD